MLVFGDLRRTEASVDKLDRIRERLAGACDVRGIDAHARRVDALIEAGELLQGVADARFQVQGQRDATLPCDEIFAVTRLTSALAQAVAVSWQQGFERSFETPDALIAHCGQLLRGEALQCKQAEGFAFYALYPEAYLMAAHAARRTVPGRWRVIGLRSIGTALASIVGAALGDAVPLTVRPLGPPFERRVAVEANWPGAPHADHYAVVDEGPGLSGSSVAAVVQRLRNAGAQAEAVHIFPGHGGGPGPEATSAVHALWRASPSHVVDFDRLALHPASDRHRLSNWVEALAGPLTRPLEEISGGGWRRAHGLGPSQQPPVHPWQERRKFLATTARGPWLVKFNGLGHLARERLECARQLGQAGFSPEVEGLCHGFMVERWHGELRPLDLQALQNADARSRLLERLADYIAFRALHLPAPPAAGATLLALTQMAERNSRLALGHATGVQWLGHHALAPHLQARVRAARTDNRMQVWEWIGDGRRLLKTDAIDHHGGHDLIGCQDPAWDVAGATAEFDLPACARATLCALLERRGCAVDAHLLDFLQPVYLAFQLGSFSLAAEGTRDLQERELLCRHARRFYREPLLQWMLMRNGGLSPQA